MGKQFEKIGVSSGQHQRWTEKTGRGAKMSFSDPRHELTKYEENIGDWLDVLPSTTSETWASNFASCGSLE